MEPSPGRAPPGGDATGGRTAAGAPKRRGRGTPAPPGRPAGPTGPPTHPPDARTPLAGHDHTHLAPSVTALTRHVVISIGSAKLVFDFR